ncbi:hypothetical protein BSZ35_03585 [Salinibacter sp. 10B]|uniref:T9SS type A sorting domain-containing protein n=1 Tax=Salinibacter sp. 10B TaxID=1923971 RepID=UPI000CF4CE41|nr:T9SS type A sorting domain-containing protein [Salinibacter sp. 10B]PQJ33804.1 hypothetical protein BSZ35_03585 [Salinibacter sp. 10B]
MPYRYACWIFLLTGILLVGPEAAIAQTELVKDINPGAAYDSNPQEPVDLNGRLFFTAKDNTHGFEPWISDGTEAGTKLVKDVYVDTDGFGPEETVALNGRAFFSAKKDDTSYRELWVSDGTAAGTYQVKEINSSSGSNPEWLAVFDGRVFFAAEGDQYGEELWVSDGTTSGTVLFKDLYPGTYQQYGQTYPLDGRPNRLVVAGTNLFFAARSVDGEELWVSDGTSDGTVQVADLYPGTNNSGSPQGLTPFGNRVVFGARDENGDYAVFISDGTESGTAKLTVADYNPDISVHDGAIYFETDNHLWKSNGTPGGTQILVRDILAQGGQPLISCGGRLFLEGVNRFDNGTDLWATDGTAAGTQRISPIAGPNYATCFNDRLYVSADDAAYGRELFMSDGTAAGTVLIKDVNPGSSSSNPKPNYSPSFVVSGDYLYFAAADPDHGVELWKTDGNPARRASLDPANLQPIEWSGLNLELIFNSLSTAVDLEAVRDLAPPDPAALGLPDAQGLAVDALWSLTLSDNAASFDADVCFSIEDLVVSGLSASDLALYKRPDANSTTWTQLTSELRPTNTPTQICAVGVTGFSQFAVTAAQSTLPVELAGFSAQRDGDAVRLNWQTASETKNAGFHVERAVEGESFTALGFVDGRGTTDAAQSYRFVDETLPFTADSLTYRLRQVDLDGTATFTDVVVVRLGEADRLTLHAPFPNPARDGVTLRYAVPKAADVDISLYNVLGQRVATFARGSMAAGRAERRLDTSRFPSGVYFVRMVAGGQVQTRRLTVVR